MGLETMTQQASFVLVGSRGLQNRPEVDVLGNIYCAAAT